ncbi:hypothetical protein CCHR01_19037 [Colletotrichum chrysophilum]|uniref:PD-(D/E)XK nuclease-like domain-containing protein n=1 Tax=Colletotrichum chrysophilum TaxID=1836956 RepID=A0AAD9E854_9PEZI|nr:hypothetical protein CCHR01_19037 [Colletotrichum chrysophilum]
MQTIGISLPLLYISGSTWQLLFAVNNPDRVELLHAHRFEGTRTIMGGSQIFALLRALRVWSETVFRDRFLSAFVRD